MNASNQLAWRINQNYNNYTAAATVPLNTWVDYVLRYDGATVKIYANGANVYTYTGVVNPTAVTNSMRLFNRESPTEEFIGQLDEFSIWNRALSSSEISTLYNTGNFIKSSNVIS